jgi:hypothetical protein
MEEFIITANLKKDLLTLLLAGKQNVATTGEAIQIINQLQNLKAVVKPDSEQ